MIKRKPLTDEELMQSLEVFKVYKDSDKDMISFDQFGKAIRKLGYTPTNDQIRSYAQDPDIIMTTKEYIEIITNYKNDNPRPISLQDVETSFQTLSPQTDIIYTQVFIPSILTRGEPFTTDEVETFLNFADKARKGKFSYKQIITAVGKFDLKETKKKKKSKKKKSKKR